VTAPTDKRLKRARDTADIDQVSIEDLQPAPGWVVHDNLRHERLVWLAARPELNRIHRKWWHALVRVQRARLDGHRPGWRPETTENEDLSKSLQRASLIIDALAGRFTAEERDVVRRTGLLPNWFWPAYLAEFDATSRR
jgi:hypothetical protein